MKKIALVLAGCGHRDGNEITEAVSLIVSLHEQGASLTYFAPQENFAVKDHVTGETTNEERNMLTETARITRGQVQDLKNLRAEDFDAVAFPGGFGVVLNLSNWGHEGAAGKVRPDVTRVLKEFYAASKPIGAVCIAPTLVAQVLGDKGVELTVGNDPETISEIKKTGARHVECPVDDYVTDRLNKIITTPAYMYKALPHQVFKGIAGLAKELVEMA